MKKILLVFCFMSAFSTIAFGAGEAKKVPAAKLTDAVSVGVSVKMLDGREFALNNMYKGMGITISFSKNNINGNSAVNTYMTSYSLNGDEMMIKPAATTKMGGPEKNMKAEMEYLELLTNARSVSLKSDILTINTSGGKSLIYKEVPKLTQAYLNGKTFNLINMFKGMKITLSFEGDRVHGFSGVNTYGASYSLDSDKIVFSSPMSTLMAGPEKNMKAETEYNDLFVKAKTATLEKDILTITTEDGVKLIYKMKK